MVRSCIRFASELKITLEFPSLTPPHHIPQNGPAKLSDYCVIQFSSRKLKKKKIIVAPDFAAILPNLSKYPYIYVYLIDTKETGE